jgi:hypothetical protein
MQCTAFAMPVSRRYFSPGELQFITSSTYRRMKLFDSHGLRCHFVEVLRELRAVYSDKKCPGKLNYMHNNLVKRGLVHSPQEWPSLRPLESHVIPAKLVLRGGGGAGIQFLGTWTPAPSASSGQAQGRLCAGVTKPMTLTSMGGPQAHDHSGQALPAPCCAAFWLSLDVPLEGWKETPQWRERDASVG